MIKMRKDVSCVLKDRTGKELCAFTAQISGSPSIDASFVGGGVASASQYLTLVTEKAFDYKPFLHDIDVDGKTYRLTSVSKSVRRRLGSLPKSKSTLVYILNLE